MSRGRRGALLVAAAVALRAAPAHADAGAPIGVMLQCEAEGRTKACPAFLRGLIDAHPVLQAAPRATADVIVYAAATEVATVDRLHLRFVGAVPGAPRVIELDVDLDTRATDDGQRAALAPVFLRGIALFVAARHPEAVTVTLGKPHAVKRRAQATSPWDAAVAVGGWGNRTERFRSFNGYAEGRLSWLTRRARVEGSVIGSAGVNRQPPLVLDDGTVVSLDIRQWNTSAYLRGGWLHGDRWALGGVARISRDDPKGQFDYTTSARVAVEWDRFAADDPRGNRLAVLYAIGHQVERYNLPNVRGERFAKYPVHGLVASGTLRHDRIGVGLSLAASAQLLAPGRRHNISASPYVQIQVGGHVDLELSFSITKRALPVPDERLIDPLDYAQLSRLSFAEPLALNGSFDITIHWDRTNGARNDRFSDL